MKWLITGALGSMGGYLWNHYSKDEEVYGLDCRDTSRDYFVKCDITDHTRVEKAIKELRPDVIIHCAAMIDVDKCEQAPGIAMTVNGIASGNIAFLASKYKARLIYISTNMVFDGTATRPYRETDHLHPLNAYGRSKLFGEENVKKWGRDWAIIRTNFYSWTPGSFGEWVYNSIKQKRKVTLYKDVLFNAITLRDLVIPIRRIVNSGRVGIWHVSSRDAVSKWQFARMMSLELGVKNNKMRPVEYKDSDPLAPRPLNAVLDCAKYGVEFQLLPSVRDSMQHFLADCPEWLMRQVVESGDNSNMR